MPDTTDAIDPQALKAARKRRGLSQQQLADTLRCTKDTVSRWERGAASRVRSHLRERLPEALRVTWEQLTKPADHSANLLGGPTVKVSIGERARAALQLTAVRYEIHPREILELAPLLFVILAERSLLARNRRFEELRATLEEAEQRLVDNCGHLGGIVAARSTFADNQLEAEERSLSKRDVFGRTIEYQNWKEGDEGPFLHFVRDVVKDLPKDAVGPIESDHGDMISRYRIADDTLRDCTGISEEEAQGEKLLDHIRSGLINLAECLRVKRDSDEAQYRQWLSEELSRADAESQRRLEEFWNKLGFPPDVIGSVLVQGGAQ